jgi:hypothetical protein
MKEARLDTNAIGLSLRWTADNSQSSHSPLIGGEFINYYKSNID